jgi:hypothetical protein
MRLAHLEIAGSLIAVMLTAPTYAQDSPSNNLSQPNSIQRTAFEYDNYLYFAPGEGGGTATGDQKTPAAAEKKSETAPANAGQNDACNGCENCASDGCRGRRWTLGIRECNLGDPWTLPQPCFLAERRITVGGWAEAGAYTNQFGAPLNGPIGMRPNNLFNLNQLNGYAERIAKQEACQWDWGGRVDYMFGTDAPLTQAFGDRTWDYGWNSSTYLGQPLYGSAIPQAYFDATYGNFKLRMGHFYTPIGYESVPAVGNFFYSHSYMHTFGEPFTNTGVLASQKLNEKLTVYGGWVDGWDAGFANANSGSMFLGGLTYALNECTNFAWYLTWGDNGSGRAFAGAAQGQLYMNSFVITHKITERWNYVFQLDYADNYNLPGNDTEWYGVNQYLFYKVSDCWGFGGRFEWFKDKAGVRVVQGNAGEYYELATGINWKPHANVMVRPEVRYDWYNGGIDAGAPFNGGLSDFQLSGGCDVIVTF